MDLAGASDYGYNVHTVDGYDATRVGGLQFGDYVVILCARSLVLSESQTSMETEFLTVRADWGRGHSPRTVDSVGSISRHGWSFSVRGNA